MCILCTQLRANKHITYTFFMLVHYYIICISDRSRKHDDDHDHQHHQSALVTKLELLFCSFWVLTEKIEQDGWLCVCTREKRGGVKWHGNITMEKGTLCRKLYLMVTLLASWIIFFLWLQATWYFFSFLFTVSTHASFLFDVLSCILGCGIYIHYISFSGNIVKCIWSWRCGGGAVI